MDRTGCSSATQTILDFEGPSASAKAESKTDVSLLRPDIFTKLAKPKPTEVFPTYWRFAAARQEIYFSRLNIKGSNPPVRDPILRQYRFTNAYRASDRVSQYLIKHVIYDTKWSRSDLFFRIMLFKFFNKIETWETLSARLGQICWANYSFEQFDEVLSSLMAEGKTIFSAAYIMPSGRSAFGGVKKHRNYLRLLEKMMSEKVPERAAQQPSLKDVFELLRGYPCIGPFTGYQYTIDLNYSTLIDFSENDFVEPGPGALDGIRKCFSDLGDYSPADMIAYMADIQAEAFELYLEAPFRDLWGRALHLIDCQNLFCEVDKYARVAHPNVLGRSGRTRIKQSYKPLPSPLEKPFFPPKWGLNTTS